MTREPAAEFAVSPEFTAILLDQTPPFDVDWRQSAFELDETERLLRLARIKALLPPGNAIDEKTTHDVTLENYIRLALQAAGDRQTLDRFCEHVHSVLELRPEGVEQLAQQVFWIWAPAAEIAGLHHHKTALEEVAFEVGMPEEYAEIRAAYDKAMFEGDDGLLRRVSEKIQLLLNNSLDSTVAYELHGRPKSYWSVRQKLRNEQRDEVQIFDLLGFRIIIDGDEEVAVEQCYVAMAAIAAEFESEKSRLKDYIVDPKPWGYQSLHLTLFTATGLPFELQVRTRAMHNEAESDNLVSHQAYEATFRETPGKIQRVARKISKLYQWRNRATAFIRDHDGRTEGVLGDDILFFRPDGNLYLMPPEGTVLDASFRIHSHRALRTKNIYQNGKLTNLSDSVRHGNVIDVIYWPDYPTEEGRFYTYSQMVRTDYARKAVEKGKRQALANEYRRLGREIIYQMVGNVGLTDPISVLDEQDRRKLADKAGLPTFDKLLELIGTGDINSGKPTRVANWIKGRLGLGEVVVIKPVPEKRGTLDNEEVLRDLVIPTVGGHMDCAVAGCCSEKIRRGDDVLVRASRPDGMLKVHLTDCKNIRDYSDTFACEWR